MKIINDMTALKERFESQNKAQKDNIDNKYGGNTNLTKKILQQRMNIKHISSVR